MNKTEALIISAERRARYAALSDSIWDHPETTFEETFAADVLMNALREEGFTVENPFCGIDTAFCGMWGSGAPVIGFLGEFDALHGLSQQPGVTEQIPVVDGGNGHGCGHHLLGVGSLAAAIQLKDYMEANKIRGTICYYGCPAEENGSGKAFMARGGAFDRLDCAITWHPTDMNNVATFSTLANVLVSYHFSGKSAHAAAAPHMGRSALDAVELMNVGVQFLREHMIPEARIHYSITNAGGASPNVVPAEAEVLYLIRAPKNAEVTELHRRVDLIAQGAALMTETKMTSTFYKACSSIVPSMELAKCMHANMAELPFPDVQPEWNRFAREIRATFEDQIMPAKRSYIRDDVFINTFKIPLRGETTVPGSSDVGDVSWICPTVQCTIAAYSSGTPEHTWQMVTQGKTELAHAGTMYAAQVMTGTAIDILAHPEILEAAKTEHRSRVGNEPYSCPIPADVTPRKV